VQNTTFETSAEEGELIPEIFRILPLPSVIESFSNLGGLGLLAKHLPVVYPETLRHIAVGSRFTGSYGVVTNSENSSAVDNDWVKIENSDEFYDDMMDSMASASTPVPKRSRQPNATPIIPPHTMAAFGLFLCLPKYSDVLLGEKLGAQCMLRLCMGICDDAEGNDIIASPISQRLPTLPFQVLRSLLDILPPHSVEAKALRKAIVDTKAIHFILAILSVFTHQPCDPALVPGLQHEVRTSLTLTLMLLSPKDYMQQQSICICHVAKL
jgi:baculoviral IAP repeat-containing protein 6